MDTVWLVLSCALRVFFGSSNFHTSLYKLILRPKGPVIIYERGGEGKNKGGAICINRLLEGGAIKFFQENEGGGGCN